MRRGARALACAAIAAWVSGGLGAGFFELSYPEKVTDWMLSLDAVAKASRHTPADVELARRIVGGWMYVGPCKGVPRDLPRNAPDAIGFVLGAGFSGEFGTAILAMIGALSRENLGREPSANLCRFALDLAKGALPGAGQ